MFSDIKEIKKTVKAIHHKVIDLDKRQEVHNHLLNEHSKRSDSLEKRDDLIVASIKPIQKHVDYVQSISWFLVRIVGLSATILGAVIAYQKLI